VPSRLIVEIPPIGRGITIDLYGSKGRMEAAGPSWFYDPP
jgi:hypothetical protein